MSNGPTAPRRRFRIPIAAMIAACLLVTAIVEGQASGRRVAANAGESPRLTITTNPAGYGVGWYNIEVGFRKAVHNRLNHAFTPEATGIDWHNVHDAVPRIGVRVRGTRDAASPYAAWTKCATPEISQPAPLHCNRRAIYVNKAHIDTTVNSSYARGVACHELGHAFGLGHRSGDPPSCMRVPAVDSRLGLDGHDRDHLDEYYG